MSFFLNYRAAGIVQGQLWRLVEVAVLRDIAALFVSIAIGKLVDIMQLVIIVHMLNDDVLHHVVHRKFQIIMLM